jgi:DNA adenine methylase
MTFLRWAGSKKQVLEQLSACWYAAQCSGASGRYVEAFSGSAVLFFRLRPKSAILVDINPALQECMRMVRDEPSQVAELLRGFCPTEFDYYRVRSQDDTLLTSTERAARFIYLNRHCFNGLYRTNRIGKFNVPYGRSRKTGQLPDEQTLCDAAAALSQAEIVTDDFYSALATEIKVGDFVYMDPPYAKANERIRNQYGPDVFGTDDLARLQVLAQAVSDRGAFFVISYAECDEIRPVATRWNTHKFTVQRTIAAQATHRLAAAELLITNL